jgi:hypothetical protein
MSWFFSNDPGDDETLGENRWAFRHVPNRMRRPDRGFEVFNMQGRDWKAAREMNRQARGEGSNMYLTLPQTFIVWGTGSALALIGNMLWG